MVKNGLNIVKKCSKLVNFGRKRTKISRIEVKLVESNQKLLESLSELDETRT
jgi:hypothetical protein